MQTQNRFFDDIARLVSNAAGAAQGLREEVEVLVRGQAERLIAEFDLVTREEFDAVQALAAGARAEADDLARRVAALEAALAGRGAAAEDALAGSLTGAAPQPPAAGDPDPAA